jgi:hypothetical protein
MKTPKGAKGIREIADVEVRAATFKRDVGDSWTAAVSWSPKEIKKAARHSGKKLTTKQAKEWLEQNGAALMTAMSKQAAEYLIKKFRAKEKAE